MNIIRQGNFDDIKTNTTRVPENSRRLVIGGYGENFTWTFDSNGTLTINGEGELNGGGNFNSSEFAETLSLAEETKTLVLDERITEINLGIFKNFEALAEVTLPPNLRLIGYEAFRGCRSLRKIIFPNTLEAISGSAFNGCASLEEVVIPESVRSIGYYAFSGCERLRKFTLPENTILGDCVLKNTAIEAACPSDIFYFNDWALGLKNDLKENTVLKFKLGTRKICSMAFGSSDYPINDEIVGVVLDGDITYIGDEAFQSCENLESVIADCTFTTIEPYAFGYTKWVNDQPQGLIYLANALLGVKDSIGGYRKEDSLFEQEFVTVNEFHNGRKITLIADGAFKRKDKIKEVTLPPSIETIGDCAFYLCKGLQKINLPDGLKKIGGRAFYDCIGLKEICIPRSVEEIGENAFGYYEGKHIFDAHKIEGFKMIGGKNSAAERYALINGIEFVDV